MQKAQESIDEQVATKLKTERASIEIQGATKARAAVADDFAKAQMEKVESDALLKQRDAKLAEATKNDIALRKERRTGDDQGVRRQGRARTGAVQDCREGQDHHRPSGEVAGRPAQGRADLAKDITDLKMLVATVRARKKLMRP